jgi:hypothetical protein
MDAKDLITRGRLVYTCKCGWIDKFHADPKSSRPTVGPAFLWKQLVEEIGTKSLFPNRNCFRVIYGQDAVLSIFGNKFYPGVEREYCVTPGLSLKVKESVALSIFQEVSYAFERKQGLAFWSGSSFSIEDLVSNLLSFYSVVRPGINYLSLCEPIGTVASLKLFEKHPDTFSTKNRTFQPKFYDCDSCPTQGPFPLALKTILPAKKGNAFSDWLRIDAWPGGIPPLHGPK